MVNPAPRIEGVPLGSPPIMPPSMSSLSSASASSSLPDWSTVPNYNSPIMDASNGTLGIPWYSLINFVSLRASTIQSLSGNVTTIQGQITTLQGQVTTLQSQMVTANTNISTLQGQMNTLLTVTVPNLQAEDTNLQSQINTINA